MASMTDDGHDRSAMSSTTNYADARPIIRGQLINKRSASKGTNKIRWDYSSGLAESRALTDFGIHQPTLDMTAKQPQAPVLQDLINFQTQYPQLSWVPPEKLYERIMNDSRNVIPRNAELANLVSDFYVTALVGNLNNIFAFAPRFFAVNFMPFGAEDGVDNNAFETYQTYLYLLSFIYFTDTYRDDPQVRELRDIQIILNWISTRRDPSITYILSGPTENSDMSKSDFKKHYQLLISPSNDMSEIIQYNQLSTNQTMSADILSILNTLKTMANVYDKTPDEARKFTVNIGSNTGVYIYVDDHGNLTFDCSYVNLGDPVDKGQLVNYSQLNSAITNNRVNPRTTTKKLAQIMQNYSRLSVTTLKFAPSTYISDLTTFEQIYVVFRGIACGERNVYNISSHTWLHVAGKFGKDNHGWFVFTPTTPVLTYKSITADVKKFEVYLTSNPDGENFIVPNDFVIEVSSENIMNHPIYTHTTHENHEVYLFDYLSSPTHNYIFATNESVNPCTGRSGLLTQSVLRDLTSILPYVTNPKTYVGELIKVAKELLANDISDTAATKGLSGMSILDQLVSTFCKLLTDNFDYDQFRNQAITSIDILGCLCFFPTPRWEQLTIVAGDLRDILDIRYEIVNTFNNVPDITTLADFYTHLLGPVTDAYNLLCNCRYGEQLDIVQNKSETYEKLTIDLTTGTINGRPFRLNANGDVDFNVDRVDERYLEYTEADNDLAILMLYKGNNSNISMSFIINQIINGSFMYSEKMQVIQNLNHNLEGDLQVYNDCLKFDNEYPLILRYNGETRKFLVGTRLPEKVPEGYIPTTWEALQELTSAERYIDYWIEQQATSGKGDKEEEDDGPGDGPGNDQGGDKEEGEKKEEDGEDGNQGDGKEEEEEEEEDKGEDNQGNGQSGSQINDKEDDKEEEEDTTGQKLRARLALDNNPLALLDAGDEEEEDENDKGDHKDDENKDDEEDGQGGDGDGKDDVKEDGEEEDKEEEEDGKDDGEGGDQGGDKEEEEEDKGDNNGDPEDDGDEEDEGTPYQMLHYRLYLDSNQLVLLDDGVLPEPEDLVVDYTNVAYYAHEYGLKTVDAYYYSRISQDDYMYPIRVANLYITITCSGYVEGERVDTPEFVVKDIVNNYFIFNASGHEVACDLFKTLEEIDQITVGKDQSTGVFIGYRYQSGILYIIIDENNTPRTETVIAVSLEKIVMAQVSGLFTVDGQQLSLNTFGWEVEMTELYEFQGIIDIYTDGILHNFNRISSYDVNKPIDYATSVCAKAFGIHHEVTKVHWNKLAYVNSILMSEIPILMPFKKLAGTSTLYLLNTIMDGKIIRLDNNTTIFQRTETEITRMLNSYVIGKRGIYKYTGNSVDFNKVLDDVYVYITGTLKWESTEPKSIMLTANHEEILQSSNGSLLRISCVFNEGVLTNVILYKLYVTGKNPADGSDVLTRFFVGQLSSSAILSGQYIVIGDYECTITYSNNTTAVSIISIIITQSLNECTEYKVINGEVYQRTIFTPRFSTVLGEIVNSSQLLFPMTFCDKRVFKIHPRIVYSEKVLINPKYINTTGTLKFTVYKNNKNLQLEAVTLRSNKNNANLTEDSTDPHVVLPTNHSISDMIHSDYVFRMEAGTDYLMTVAGIQRNCNICSDAIRPRTVEIVPTSPRMQLTMEFT